MKDLGVSCSKRATVVSLRAMGGELGLPTQAVFRNPPWRDWAKVALLGPIFCQGGPFLLPPRDRSSQILPRTFITECEKGKIMGQARISPFPFWQQGLLPVGPHPWILVSQDWSHAPGKGTAQRMEAEAPSGVWSRIAWVGRARS